LLCSPPHAGAEFAIGLSAASAFDLSNHRELDAPSKDLEATANRHVTD
jgi:hypothetical protein